MVGTICFGPFLSALTHSSADRVTPFSQEDGCSDSSVGNLQSTEMKESCQIVRFLRVLMEYTEQSQFLSFAVQIESDFEGMCQQIGGSAAQWKSGSQIPMDRSRKDFFKL